MKKKTKPKPSPSPAQTHIDLRWGDAGHLSTLYSNNLFLTHTESQFYLIFGELLVPTILDPVKEQDRIPKHLEVKPLTRIAVSPRAMEKFVEAMTINFKKFQGKYGAKDKE